MRRKVLAVVVLALVASAAQASPITHTVDPVGTFTVSYQGASVAVDVYDLWLHAEDGYTVGAVLLYIGNISGTGDDPFQVGKRIRSGDGSEEDPYEWENKLTPTQKTALSVINTTSYNLRDTDSRFLPYDPNDPNGCIENWAPVVTLPTEWNDKSLYYAGDESPTRFYLGTGSMKVETAVPVSQRVQDLLVARIGIVEGTQVWIHDRSADNGGRPIDELYPPEPATMGLLGLGGLTLLRRKRG